MSIFIQAVLDGDPELSLIEETDEHNARLAQVDPSREAITPAEYAVQVLLLEHLGRRTIRRRDAINVQLRQRFESLSAEQQAAVFANIEQMLPRGNP